MISFNLEDDDEIAEVQEQIEKKMKVVRVPIHLPMLVFFFTKDQILKIDGLPSDARYVGWLLDPERQDIIYLFVTSEEFKEIAYGDFVPLWEGEINISRENYDMQALAKDIIEGGE